MNGQTWEEAEHVLCIRLDSLGDVLMTTPAIRALKEGRTGRRISLLTSPSGAEAGKLIPEVDALLVYEAPWMKATPVRADAGHDFAAIDRLCTGNYDAAAIFTVFSQNPLPAALMAYLAGIPLRLAYSRENPYQLLTDWAPDPVPHSDAEIPHEVRRHLDLVARVGCRTEDERLSLRVPAGAHSVAIRQLKEAGIATDRPWVVVHSGATAPSRRYPPESFAEAACRLIVEHGWQVVFTGANAERGLVEEIRARMEAPAVSLAGKLDLSEFAALIDLAPLLISNNSGPVHIAAALGTPVVDIYALTNPQHTPWGVPQRVLSYDVPCKYCYKSVCPLGHHACLRGVKPEEVAAAAVELFQLTNEAGRGRLLDQVSAQAGLGCERDQLRVEVL